MLYVSYAILKSWNPPLLNAAGRRAAWTSVTVQGVQLTNSLEEAAWNVDPAQVHICHQCGIYGCYDGGYVRITRLGEYLLWTAPYKDDTLDMLDLDSAAGVVYERGAVLIPHKEWESWRRQVPALPELQTFPAATRRELAAAWRLEAPPELRELPWIEMIARITARLLAADTLEYDQALDQVHNLLDWFVAAPDEPLSGEPQPIQSIPARVETLRFDGPADQDWPALVCLADRWYPALGREWAYIAVG